MVPADYFLTVLVLPLVLYDCAIRWFLKVSGKKDIWQWQQLVQRTLVQLRFVTLIPTGIFFSICIISIDGLLIATNFYSSV